MIRFSFVFLICFDVMTRQDFGFPFLSRGFDESIFVSRSDRAPVPRWCVRQEWIAFFLTRVYHFCVLCFFFIFSGMCVVSTFSFRVLRWTIDMTINKDFGFPLSYGFDESNFIPCSRPDRFTQNACIVWGTLAYDWLATTVNTILPLDDDARMTIRHSAYSKAVQQWLPFFVIVTLTPISPWLELRCCSVRLPSLPLIFLPTLIFSIAVLFRHSEITYCNWHQRPSERSQLTSFSWAKWTGPLTSW